MFIPASVKNCKQVLLSPAATTHTSPPPVWRDVVLDAVGFVDFTPIVTLSLLSLFSDIVTLFLNIKR